MDRRLDLRFEIRVLGHISFISLLIGPTHPAGRVSVPMLPVDTIALPRCRTLISERSTVNGTRVSFAGGAATLGSQYAHF
jgi:hypothetical protein